MKRCLQVLILLGLLGGLTGCADMLPVSIAHGQSAGRITPQPNLYAVPEETPTFQTPLMEPRGEINLWAREQLEPAVQETYDRLSQAVACHQETEVEVDASPEEVQLVLTALRIDHPEYFWFDGEASYVSTTLPVVGETTSCTMGYTMTMAEAQSMLPQVESYVSACLSAPELAAAQSDYDKILGVYRYIINSTDYVVSATDQSFLSVMTQHQGTCAGYARTFQYLMHRLGIPCTMALGLGESGENHGWNIVSCGGQWYQIDVTWGDPVDDTGAPGTSLEYTYCLVTDEEIFRTHTLDSEIPMPVCTATEYNYFRKSGLQMTAWDSVRYESLLQSAVNRGESWFTVRFDHPEDYDAALSALIDQAGIMTILQNCGVSIPADGVTYSRNDLFSEFSVQIA